MNGMAYESWSQRQKNTQKCPLSFLSVKNVRLWWKVLFAGGMEPIVSHDFHASYHSEISESDRKIKVDGLLNKCWLVWLFCSSYCNWVLIVY